MSLIKLEICEPFVPKTVQRNCMKLGNDRIKYGNFIEEAKNNEFQKPPLGGVLWLYCEQINNIQKFTKHARYDVHHCLLT